MRESVSASLTTMTQTLERELEAEAARRDLDPASEREAALNSIASTPGCTARAERPAAAGTGDGFRAHQHGRVDASSVRLR